PSSALFEPSLEPSYYPSSPPSLMSIQDYIETYVLQRSVKFNGMDAFDPRKMALNWITETDPLQLDASDANLQQRYVLALLFYSFSEDNYLGWLSDNTECEWSGVACNYGNVIKLEIGGNELTGTIPPEIGRLEHLEFLDMSYNSLSGTLPPELGNLTNLTKLFIQENHFNSSIPSELGNLVQLTKLALDRNKFTGSLPSDLGNLNDLMEFFVFTNQLTGTLPPEIGRLRNLEQLSVGRNFLNGTLPSELGNLKNLNHLGLDNNRFTGSLPTELEELLSLTKLRLNGNQFTGTYLSGLGNCKTGMAVLCVNSSNHFSGDLPTECDADGLNCWDFTSL
ncbi:hypothetical protein ACHAWX_000331, partial [Stephanocyclus meneghinianus]